MDLWGGIKRAAGINDDGRVTSPFAFFNPGATATTLAAQEVVQPGNGGEGLRGMMQRRHRETLAPTFAGIRGEIERSTMNPEVKRRLLAMPVGDINQLRALEDEYAKATRGTGVYGTLNRSYAALNLMRDRPGAMQLFGNTQARSQARGGMLSEQPTGLLTTPIGVVMPGSKK